MTKEAENISVEDNGTGSAHVEADKLKVKLPIFEGPLDLLLHLVKKNEIDIYDIPIVEITEQYFNYLDLMKQLNIDVAGDYLVMAATLIHIKSKMLLPPEPSEEEAEPEDPRKELVERLLEYQRYKAAAEKLALRDQLGRDVFARSDPQADMEGIPVETSLEDADLFQLLEAFQGVLKRLPDDAAHEITVEKVSVREKIVFLIDTFRERERADFTELFSAERSKISAIALFLALLECIRMGLLRVRQADLLDKIEVERTPACLDEDVWKDARDTAHIESDS